MDKKKSLTSKDKERLKRYFKTEKGKAAAKRYVQSEKGRITSRRAQKAYHASHREQENANFKKHYQENKEYHKEKNRQHYKKNGEKWKARRAEISKEWLFNKCSPTFVEACFESVGASLKTETTITFSQCCALIKAFGYDLEDVTYPPFINRKKYFDKKRTP